MTELNYALWYDNDAQQAVTAYLDLFEDSQLLGQTTLPDTPSGDVDFLAFRLGDLEFSAMSAGDYFKLNESISIMVTLNSKQAVDRLYVGLSQGGSDLMPLGSYDFNPYYAWVRDRFGLTWQLLLDEEQTRTETFKVCLLFGQEQCGQALPAMTYLVEHLDGTILTSQAYPDFPGKSAKAQLVYGEAEIFGKKLVFMDHGFGGDASFNGAFSLALLCQTQAEIDQLWQVLSKVPEAEACGWCQDDFGLAWQVMPQKLAQVTMTADRDQLKLLQAAYYPMKKFDLAVLENLW